MWTVFLAYLSSGMVFGHLLLLRLLVLPGALDHYMQAKIKQYLMNPIYNFLYTIFVSWLGIVLAFLIGVLSTITKAGMQVLHVVYQDIIYLLALVLYLFLYAFWAIASVFQWCCLTLLSFCQTIYNCIYVAFAWLLAAITSLFFMFYSICRICYIHSRFTWCYHSHISWGLFVCVGHYSATLGSSLSNSSGYLMFHKQHPQHHAFRIQTSSGSCCAWNYLSPRYHYL